MKKWRLHLIGFLSMIVAGIIATVIMINDGGYWTIAPLITWFVLGQIYLVPRILGRKHRWGLMLVTVALMAASFLMMGFISDIGGGYFSYISPLIWVLWASLFVMPKLLRSEEKNHETHN